MHITNRKNLPQPIVDAIKNDAYSRGDSDISATQLISPPRQVAIIEQMADRISEDASENIWSLLGKAVHNILEMAGTGGIREERLFEEVEGWIVSGQMDHFVITSEGDQNIVSDYKVTSVWSIIFGDRVIEWEKQMNIYAWLMAKAGYEVDRLQVVALLRDWQHSKAERDRNYPRAQVEVVPIDLWDEEKQVAFIAEMVKKHQAAREVLPLCTKEERWAKGSTWIIAKEGRKSAVRVFDSIGEAKDYAISEGLLEPTGKGKWKKGYSLVERIGDEWVRCRNYCAAAPFCEQYQGELTLDA